MYFDTEIKKFAVECKWREKLHKDLCKDVFTSKRMEGYITFSESREMPVTVVLGVGGEPCAPELVYIIPLENLEDVVSHTLPITKILYSAQTMDIPLFLRIK